MNAPVTTALPAVRPAAPRASDTGVAHSAAPFASALDGALNESRAHASDRGAERRSTPDERAARADDRARAADQRAVDKAKRVEAREARAAERATRGPEETASESAEATPARPVDDATAPDDAAPETDDETTDAAGRSAEAPRGGLPALWALVMGGSLASAPAQDTAPDAGATVPAALPGVPAMEAATAGVPAATATAATSPADATAPPATGPAVPGAAVPAAETVATPAVPAAAAAPAAPIGEGLPAGFSAVLAEAGAVVPPSADATAGATTPVATPAPALPVDLVLEAVSAAGTPTPTEAPAVVPAPAPAPAPAATDGEVGTTGAGTADVVVAPGGDTSGEALSADAGADGRRGPEGTTGQPTLGAAASVPAPTTAAVADVDGATGAAATLPVGAQVARQVAVLSGGPDGDHSMTLVLTPDTLGEVQVQVTLRKGSIELALRGAHEHGRAALLDALPELRRELEAAGLNPSRVEVARDTGGSLLDRPPAQQGFGDRGQHDRGDARSRPWGRPADIGGSGPSPNPNRATSSGVDVLV